MSTITIRNLPEEIIERMKKSASRQGISMEKEIRETLKIHYMSKVDVIQRVRENRNQYPRPEAKDIDAWIEAGRE